MFLPTNERIIFVREGHCVFGKLPSIDTSCPPCKKLALAVALVQKDYSTVTKYKVRNERVHSKDFLTNKMKASIFHFREQGPTEVHPLFITSGGRGIIKVTEV